MANPDDVPMQQVRNMRNQGISDDKIVEALQRDGYMSSQIFDAMTQADMKPAKEVKEVTEDFPNISQSVQGPPPPPSEPITPFSAAPPPQQMRQSPSFGGSSTEELIESIIDEKWNELQGTLEKIVEWKRSTEKKLTDLETDFVSLKQQFDKLHQAVIGKIGDYDKNILNVGAEIKAMEKAFSKIIPEFAESVSEMSDLVEKLKKKED